MAKWVTSVPATGIALDRNGAAPLHRQLYQQLRAAILAGQLGAATRLPSTRTLAGELGVSRTTALLAYEQLRDEGYLDGRIGAGTTVAPLPRQAPRRQPQARPALSLRGATMAGAAWPGDERRRDRPHAFQLGMPDIEHFPWRLWARALGQRARPGLAALPGERDPAGYYPLRAAAAARARRRRRSGRRRWPAARADCPRGVRDAVAPVPARRDHERHPQAGVAGLGAPRRRAGARGRLRQRVPLRRPPAAGPAGPRSE